MEGLYIRVFVRGASGLDKMFIRIVFVLRSPIPNFQLFEFL